MTLFLCRRLSETLLSFLDMCIKDFQMDQWLFAIPLCHFLYDCCKPYQSVYDQRKANHTNPNWWGVEHFKPLVDKYKSETKYRTM